MRIDSLPGLTPDQIARVRGAGIRTCRQLLQSSRRLHRLQALAGSTGLPVEVLRRIADQAELTRVRGIGPAALTSLFRSGVTSLSELATENPANLHSRLRQTTSGPPNLAMLENWILQARQRARLGCSSVHPNSE